LVSVPGYTGWRAIIRTVPERDVLSTMLELGKSDALCSATCTHCGALNTFPGMSSIIAFVCREVRRGRWLGATGSMRHLPQPKTKAAFIEPMLLLRTNTLPDGPNWLYELKLDGYRALGIKSGRKAALRSRNNNDFTRRYADISRALAALPDETVVDGEVVALDEDGRPSFNLLQNYGSAGAPLFFYVFDVLILAGRNVMAEPLDSRRELLHKRILPKLGEPIRCSPPLPGSLPDLVAAVREQGLEGLVAKRRDSIYEPGQRSGAWQKMRINQGQEFVIGGYTIGSAIFDALIFGYYEGDQLLYVARTRNGFTPALRAELMKRFRGLETPECPFANLPEKKSGRWGQGLTAAKMKDCRWLRPELVGQFEFTEWTPDNHLRHSRFVGLREDKDPRQVRREG
jgi:DNA ligase D-like protein (predicted ligase)